ncbi:hypothetical protein FS749_009068 [Ceratobasidium sp. UAMH 11750]|nr:hypothetical protein FS749_009068 [Ceratobasidium sp. UAMH 11750]
MSKRVPYVGPHQENFSLPRRLGHKRSVSLLSSCSHSSQDLASPAPKSPRSAQGIRPRPIPPSLVIPIRISSPKNLPNQLVPSSPTPSDFTSSLRCSYSPFVCRLWTSSTSTTSALEDSLLDLEELIQVLGTPPPIQLEFRIPEREMGSRSSSRSVDVVGSCFMPEKIKMRGRTCLWWLHALVH